MRLSWAPHGTVVHDTALASSTALMCTKGLLSVPGVQILLGMSTILAATFDVVWPLGPEVCILYDPIGDTNDTQL